MTGTVAARILVESNAGSEMEDVRAVANRDHQAATGVELSFKQGPGQIRDQCSPLSLVEVQRDSALIGR